MIDAEQYLSCDRLIARSTVAAMRADAARVLASQFNEMVGLCEQPFLQPIYDLEVPRMAFGRVALVGDAAFVARPHVGAGVAKAAEDALAIMGSEIGLEPARVSAIVRQGGVYQEILEEAAASGADLIVMTSHRPPRHAVRTYFLGSSTGHVVRYARCSVLVVRK